MKWFNKLDIIIQYYVLVGIVLVLYGAFTLLDKLIDKL
jgi:hypothetical protein